MALAGEVEVRLDARVRAHRESVVRRQVQGASFGAREGALVQDNALRTNADPASSKRASPGTVSRTGWTAGFPGWRLERGAATPREMFHRWFQGSTLEVPSLKL